MTAAASPRRLPWLGTATVFQRELARTFRLYWMTVAGPVMTALLFLVVFRTALGGEAAELDGLPVLSFLAPGLIMLALVMTAFSTSAYTVVHAKIERYIEDDLMAPIGPAGWTAAFAGASVVSALAVAAAVGLAIAPFVDFGPVHLGWVAVHGVGAATLLSLLGLAAGIWARTWDKVEAVVTFAVVPFGYLSGTFYPLDRLPDALSATIGANPVYFAVDGLRHGLTGKGATDPAVGALVLLLACIAAWALCHALVARGYKLKA